MFEIYWTRQSQRDYDRLKSDPTLHKRYKTAKKTIELLASNPRHPSLQTHEFTSLKGPNGEKVFEAYAEQSTSAACGVFWCYGPSKGQITIIAIARHPYKNRASRAARSNGFVMCAWDGKPSERYVAVLAWQTHP